MTMTQTATRQRQGRRRRPVATNPEKYGNRSVIMTATMLDTLAALGGQATLGEVAARLNMLESRAQRYLLSLAASGLAEYRPGDGCYTLGPRLIELGLVALGQVDSVRLASDTLYQLTEDTGIVALLSVWGSNGATVIKCENPEPASPSPIREGRNLSLATSATGRIFLSYLPPETTAPFLQQELSGSRSPLRGNAGRVKLDIEQIKRDVRRTGLARSAGIFGNDAIAAPVFNHEGVPVMVLALFSRGGTEDFDLAGNNATKLKNAARDLSRKLGAEAAKGA